LIGRTTLTNFAQTALTKRPRVPKIDAVEVRFDAKLDKRESKVMTAIMESKQQLNWLIVGALVVQFASRLIK
jgi:hypothetical protein